MFRQKDTIKVRPIFYFLTKYHREFECVRNILFFNTSYFQDNGFISSIISSRSSLMCLHSKDATKMNKLMFFIVNTEINIF